MGTVNISTRHLIIRQLSLADLSDFHSYRSNVEIAKYQGFDVMTIYQAEEFIKDNALKFFGKAGEWIQYGIEDNKTKQLIGDCAIKLNPNDTRIAEIGITISHLEQKKGYATEVLMGILTFLFETKGIHRIVALVDAENIASINLMKRVGFRQEGYFVENTCFKGKWGSELLYAMLKREWDDKKILLNK